MSENKHTPEPWRTDEECGFPQDIHDSKGNLFLRCGSDFDNEIYGEANARRIVACVNACAGISQQYLEELNGETLADKQMVLITQRDEYSLLAYRRQNILDEVIKQRDELLSDAQRYRWLRIHGLQRAWVSLGTDCDGENFAEFKCEFKVPEPPNLPYEDEEGFEWADKDFDAAIDAAIASLKGEQP